ncbi:MAG: hypothetical protein LBJ67_09485 [Planctomycetaceae bacterium]|jgi:predicted RNA-binding Zn-ribbon protein involved in translation (DUF1610 family)|nr:hypothetical protein [Planctomycetaceae bacterium]
MTNPYQPPDHDFDDSRYEPRKPRYGAEYDEARERWPRCPECGKRLTICCPFCRTAGNLFPLGDTEYWSDDIGGSLVEYQHKIDRQEAKRSVLFGEGDTSLPYRQHPCSRHKMGKTPGELYCGTRPELVGNNECNENEFHNNDFDGNVSDDCCADDVDQDWTNDFPERDYDKESLPFVVICPTCGEAFIPTFPGGCRHCHYVWDKSKSLNFADNEPYYDQQHHSPKDETLDDGFIESSGLSLRESAVIIIVLVLLIVFVFSYLC